MYEDTRQYIAVLYLIYQKQYNVGSRTLPRLLKEKTYLKQVRMLIGVSI
jgi:hypothetical protein